MTRRSFTLFLFLSLISSISAFAKERCSVCGMAISENSLFSYQEKSEKKIRKLCSFSCASKIAEKNPKAELSAKDYSNHSDIDASNAYFLVGSKALENEAGFTMPPFVAAFKSEKDAEATKARLGDGKILHGFDAARRHFSSK